MPVVVPAPTPSRRRQRRLFAGVLAATLPLLAGCGAVAGGDAGDGRPRIVASFYPLQYVAQRVVGDHATVDNLTSPGVEPHDVELSVPQTAAIAEADVAFYLEGFQPAVDEALAQSGPDQVVEVSDVVELETVEGHHAEHAGEEHSGEEHEEGHDHGDVDPHFWLDPQRLGRVAAAFTDTMVEHDEEHAADYRANLRALQADLDALDRAYTRGLGDCARDTVVVSHDAFGYLEQYGVHFESIAGLSPDAEPSPDHLARLHELAESEGVTTVFSERLASPALAETLARDLGLRTAVLDPIEGLTEATQDEDYLSLMRADLDALRKANDCR